MNMRWFRIFNLAKAIGFGGSFPTFKAKRTQKAKKHPGTIFNYHRSKLKIWLGMTIILAGLAGGTFLSIRATQQDTSHLARIPKMITTPGGDTQRNSDQYQATVKLANQQNIAKVKDTSESYILIPEEVTETIQIDEMTVPLPWSTSQEEIAAGQNHELVTRMAARPLPQEKQPITNAKTTSEDILAELNHSLDTATPFASNVTQSVPSQYQGDATIASANSNTTTQQQKDDVSKKQSKYGLAVLNQMNAIANALVVQTPEAGFVTAPEDQVGGAKEPSEILAGNYANEARGRSDVRENAGLVRRISAGSIYYAEVISEVTSDFPSPILVEITHGLHKGWRLVGQFNTSPGGKGVLVSFDKLVDLAGREFAVSALAIDGIEGQSLIASKVEPRLLQRYGPVFATSFIAGLAESLAQPRSTLGVIGNSQILVAEPSSLEQAGYAGLQNSFSAISSDIINHIPKGPLITIASGHPVGILFTASSVNLN